MDTAKYARPELERRFLLRAVPPTAVARHRIVDRYVTGTRLRLRRMDPVDGAAPPAHKLALKDRPDPADPSVVMITNLYLTPDEHRLLERLPADVLSKTRHGLPDAPATAVDLFEGNLAGLVLLEVSLDDMGALAAYDPPAFAGPEVTRDDRYSGAGLARASADEARRLVEEATRRSGGG